MKRGAEKRENFGEKLRRAGKRGGQTTPVASFSRPNELAPAASQQFQHTSIIKDSSSRISGVSARKLAATLWELDQYNKLPTHKMHHGVPRLRRLNHKAGLHEPIDPSPSSPDLPGSSGNLRKHVAALMQHHRLTERSTHAIQTVSPASYGSSMEIAPYNPAVTPTSSVELKGRTGNSLRTSTELLKVLNRIWSLEEQHVSNMSLVKALKKELDHARSKIKELVREQQADRHEMDEFMKQMTEDKLFRKNKEENKIDLAIKSMRDELENERKLRKRSESLHRKLARELYDVKTTFASVSDELEKERKCREVMEDFCDEFALGIREYEKRLHGMRRKSDKDDWDERDDCDQLILHVSESWIDERLQMKLQPGQGNKSAVEKLSSEIEAFLQAKRSDNNIKNNNAKKVPRDPAYRRSSLESIPLNMAVSAPQGENDGDSADSNCFELKSERNSQKDHNGETVKPKQVNNKPGSSERSTGPSASDLQKKFETQMAQAMLHGEIKNEVEENPVEIIQKPEKSKSAKENGPESKYDQSEGFTGLNSNNMIENLIRNHYLLSESGIMGPDKDYGVASSIWRSHPSPVRQWTEKLPSRDPDVSESSSKLPSNPDLKENTLKAKLLEARTRGQRSRARLKASIIPTRINE